jgi:hypothetical protein
MPINLIEHYYPHRGLPFRLLPGHSVPRQSLCILHLWMC